MRTIVTKTWLMASALWMATHCGGPDWCGGSDVNRDSIVDFADFALFDGCNMFSK